ncbi:MAG: NAD(P)H-hydrate epimerase [Phycisphaerae bacterium]
MRPLTRDESRSIDRMAIETLGIPGVILMENAGRNTAEHVARLLDGAERKNVFVVAGSGNNGGDGFVVARHLANWGAAVTTVLVAPREKLSGDAETNFRAIEALGHRIIELGEHELPKLAELLGSADVVIDAVGGTGIQGELRGSMATAVEQINAAGRDVVAIDIPTGLDCDTGQAGGACVKAVCTVTMVARKKGFDAPAAAEYTGEVVPVDIGIPAEWLDARANAQQ